MSQPASARAVMPAREPAAAPAIEAGWMGRETGVGRVAVGVDVGGGGEAVEVRRGSGGVVLVDERDA